MRRILLFPVLVMILFPTRGQDLAVSKIPEEIKVGAEAVVRYDNTFLTIAGPSSATLRTSYAITILNANAKNLARKSVFYDKFRKINEIEASVFDADGKQIKKLKKSDIKDYSLYDGSMLSDNRRKYFDLTQISYPYTVEIEYEYTLGGLLSLPDWYVVPDENVSVQSAKLTVIHPANYDLRYKTRSLEDPQKRTAGGNRTLLWAVRNQKALHDESFDYSFFSSTPRVQLAPSRFVMDGYEGNQESWQSFGQWMNKLMADLGPVPPQTANEIRNLVKDTESDREKIRLVYNYLQENTRYISIQLGIGGWKPFTPQFVDEKGYGDCKALSWFTKSMLKEIGISSNYVLIDAGAFEDDIDIDFPSNQFNHAILCVPNKGDTIWLECTSQSNPFGYLGTFTSDRHALLIDDAGGKVVKTPAYAMEENLQLTMATVTLDSDGSGQLDLEMDYNSLEYENYNLDRILLEPEEKQKKWLYDYLSLQTFTIEDFDLILSENEQGHPLAELKMTASLNQAANKTGKRLFIVPNMLNRGNSIKRQAEERRSDVILRYAYHHADTIIFDLPREYHVESVPNDIQFESRFGDYSASFIQEGEKLTYIRHFRRKKGTFPAESYEELLEFYRKVARSDKKRVVLVNKT